MYPERQRAQVILYYFSFLQRDCENLILYNVVLFFLSLSPFSEFQHCKSKASKSKSARRDLKHKVLILSVAFKQTLRQMFKDDMASLFQPSPT